MYKYENKGRKGEKQRVAKRKVTDGAVDGRDILNGNPDRDGGRETEGEGEDVDLPGYKPMLEGLHLREFYGEWVHTNDGGHLSGGIADDTT